MSTITICLPFISNCQQQRSIPKVHLHEIEKAKKREKHRILNTHVGKRSTRGGNTVGAGEKKKVKRNESTMMCSDVAHEWPFIRPQRDIYWGKKERQ